MKLPETYRSNISSLGFTLVELLLVMALVLIVGMVTSSIGISYYQSQILTETTDNFTSVLRQAQGYAMSGKNNSAFGIFVAEDSYVLFEGQDYESRLSNEDMIFPINSYINISGPSEIIFSPFTGTSNVVDTVYISFGSRAKQVEILSSGYIDK
jgi:prepilin-type N-terminal cleavage/methylation domain-containing protein